MIFFTRSDYYEHAAFVLLTMKLSSSLARVLEYEITDNVTVAT